MLPHERLKVYASKNEKEEHFVTVVNMDPKTPVTSKISLSGTKSINTTGKAVRFSSMEYRWDPKIFSTAWNTGPSVMNIVTSSEMEYTFPPFSST